MVDCIEKLLHERERERPPELVGCKGLELLRHVRCGFSHQRTAAGRLGVSADVSVAARSVWPRVLVARSAMRAAARRKMLPASSARWKPATSACGGAVWIASRWWVRPVASAEKIASPSAPPSCWEALSSEAASPALSGGTPALAAVVTPTNTGRVPMRDSSWEEMPAAITVAKVSGR